MVEEGCCAGSQGAPWAAESAFPINWNKRNISVELSRVKSCCWEPLSYEYTSTLQGKEGWQVSKSLELCLSSLGASVTGPVFSAISISSNA